MLDVLVEVGDVAARERAELVVVAAREQERQALAKKQAEGKTRREALRCLKRHLARRVWRLLIQSERGRSITPSTLRGTCPRPQFAAVA